MSETSVSTEIIAISETELTDAQKEYIRLERQLTEHDLAVKDLREQFKAVRDQVIDESGIKTGAKPTFFQDEFGTVHCVKIEEWMSVQRLPWVIAHTRRLEFGEVKGSLSMKDAQSAGFQVEGK